MRWSTCLIPTLKEVPQDAEIPSHQLLLRAGFLRKLSSGLYTFLPLAHRSLMKVTQIIREEMNAAGALEVLMPAMQPPELWERTGRLEALDEVMFHVKDRQDRPLVLGPTHEEVITELVSREVNSYKQLPLNFYQIQSKFRDEIRPRFGLMRAREFIMKDAYSFDSSWEGVDQTYRAMYDAYERIFFRCGLETKVVEADTGAMGGSDSHEFMVLADSGEDLILESDSGPYAANAERAVGVSRDPVAFEGADLPVEEIHTPGVGKIDGVCELLNAAPVQMIKTLVYRVGDQPVVVLLPGNRDVNEIKLAKVLDGDVALADDATVQAVTGAPVGFAGPIGLPEKVRCIADVTVKNMKGAITGANKADYHLKHVNVARDLPGLVFEDICFAREGDGSPDGQGTLRERRGIEVGHVFKLGRKYSEALGATYLDADGKEQTAIMGCYGIGVTRTLQSIVEQSHDEHGIIWPISVAPFEVEVLTMKSKSGTPDALAETLVKELEDTGIEVLFDDRDERPGVKFKDADLLGIPLRVAVGGRSLEQGMVEIKLRRESEAIQVPVDEALSTVVKKVKALKQERKG